MADPDPTEATTRIGSWCLLTAKLVTSTPTKNWIWPPDTSHRGLTWAGAGWWAVNMAEPAGFVGREGELSRLLGALGGDARLVLVVGLSLIHI